MPGSSKPRHAYRPGRWSPRPRWAVQAAPIDDAQERGLRLTWLECADRIWAGTPDEEAFGICDAWLRIYEEVLQEWLTHGMISQDDYSLDRGRTKCWRDDLEKAYMLWKRGRRIPAKLRESAHYSARYVDDMCGRVLKGASDLPNEGRDILRASIQRAYDKKHKEYDAWKAKQKPQASA